MPPSSPQTTSDAPPSSESPGTSDRATDTAVGSDPPDDDRGLEREVERLRAALDRRDRRLQSVIDHYEGLLADQRADREEHTGARDGRRGFAILRRWLR